jgi:redox-sensitive bicupin YhaK (pirin superfamily)
MSNLELRPAELTCEEVALLDRRAPLEILEPREVPLGGPRAMSVRRTLPQRRRSLIGGWCFLDHYGPDEVSVTGGMRVPPHPHTGLQTVSWLFTGEIEHRDSAGFHAMVRPGEMNLMTAGRGICHSEVSTPDTTVLHGVQLWVALPSAARFVDRGFEHYVPEPVSAGGCEARVFLGSLLGSVSPVRSHSPLVGAEISLQAGASVQIPVQSSFEHGVLVDAGTVTLDGSTVETNELGFLPTGHDTIELSAVDDGPARVVFLGGEPLGEAIVMWWNFVGRSHEDIVEYRAAWQAEIGAEQTSTGDWFGTVVGNTLAPLPAPPLPNARIRPRE